MTAADSFEAIKDLLSRVGDGGPSKEEVMSIHWAFSDVYHRLMKVRVICPKTDYSDRMWMMLELAGFPNKCLRQKTGV